MLAPAKVGDCHLWRMTVAFPTEPLTRSGRGLRRLAIALLSIWAIIVTALGLRLSGVFEAAGGSEALSLPLSMTRATLAITGVTLLLAVLTLLIRPAWLLNVLSGASLLAVASVAVVTGATGALLAAIIITGLAVAIGHLLLCLIRSAPTLIVTRVALDLALGFAALGLLWFVLGSVGLLAPLPTILGSLALLAALGLLARNRGTLPVSRPMNGALPPAGFLPGLALAGIWGIVLFAALGAFVPESQSDAIKQHLPIAREFWQAHRIFSIESMPVTSQSIQQHLLFSVAYGFGGPIAPQLLQAVFGLAAVLGVAALAWELEGQVAAVCAAAIYGLAPIVLWEFGHAFIDVLPVVLTTGAVLCLLQWQMTADRVWLILAGALCGVGIATKLTVTAVVVAIVVSIAIVGRAPWHWRDRASSVAFFGLGALTILPWLIVNTAMTGRIYGTEALMARLGALVASASAHVSTPPDARRLTQPLAQVAMSEQQNPARHGLRDFITMPWLLTFDADTFAFPIIGRGELGIAPLVLAPFTLLLPRRRTTALLMMIVAVSFVLWWLTPLQILRHLLPCFAIAAALMGAAAARILSGWTNGWLARATAISLAACLMVSLVITPVFFLIRPRAAIPVDYLIGHEDRAAVLASSIRTAKVIQAVDTFVPPGAPVAYLGRVADAPQLYTEAQLVYLDLNNAGDTPEATLETLSRLNIRYVLWERSNGSLFNSSVVLRSTPFLRQYARILAADDDAYLFEILHSGDTTWGEAQVTNLLQDSGFQHVKGKKSAWEIEGQPQIDEGTVTLSRKSSIAQSTPVQPGVAYILETPVRCLEESGRAVLTFHWLDSAGSELGTVSEAVSPGQTVSDQFLWRRAPDKAASVRTVISMSGSGRCEFSGAVLYALP
ncbi:MAG: glycosyltransferase family 39 protein [Thermomicrobiales bacterium]